MLATTGLESHEKHLLASLFTICDWVAKMSSIQRGEVDWSGDRPRPNAEYVVFLLVDGPRVLAMGVLHDHGSKLPIEQLALVFACMPIFLHGRWITFTAAWHLDSHPLQFTGIGHILAVYCRDDLRVGHGAYCGGSEEVTHSSNLQIATRDLGACGNFQRKIVSWAGLIAYRRVARF